MRGGFSFTHFQAPTKLDSVVKILTDSGGMVFYANTVQQNYFMKGPQAVAQLVSCKGHGFMNESP